MVGIPDFAMIFTVCAILNIIIFFIYTLDKRAARKNTWRTPENFLLFFALIGPFGAWTAMRVLRHKTRKIKFYLVPLFAILHITLLVGILISGIK
jgi:uncharacterized membrane protein YsdA (DUF1294 family)